MNGKVLVLGGGKDQVPLLEILNDRGYETIIIDYFENPVAKDTAAKHYQQSSHDAEIVEQVAMAEGVRFICSSGNDPVVPVIAKVSAKLGLNTPLSYEAALMATDKSLMKKRFSESKIPSARIYNHRHLKNIGDIRFPIIVKPVNGTSSKGVIRFDNINALEEYLATIDDLSALLIEEFIEGPEISVDCISYEGKGIVINVTELAQVPNLEGFSFLYTESPFRANDIVLQKINDIAQKISDAFSINFGPYFFQAKVRGNEVCVIEIGARIAGGNKPQTIKAATGFDILSVYVDMLEVNPKKLDFNFNNRFVSKVHIYVRSGIVGEIKPPEEVYITSIEIHKKLGEPVGEGVAAKDRVLSMLLEADTYEVLQKYRKWVFSNTIVNDQDGHDLVRRDLYKN
ncbi:MAG: ATP-grasp domain-containing protein [Flavobacterium sp.]|nr:ATP-grasp domain-containing protein [Flavobacterium sp.]